MHARNYYKATFCYFDFQGQLIWCKEGFVCKTTPGCYRLDRINEFPIKCPDPALEIRSCGFAVVDDAEIYIAFGYVKEPDFLHALPEDALNRQRIWLERNNFCKFDLKSSKWTVLTPMQNLIQDCYLRLHKFGDYLYALGLGINDMMDEYLVQRFNLVTKKWEESITVSMPGENWLLEDHAVVEGHILFTSFTYDDDDDIQYAFLAYNPTSNIIFKVDNKTSSDRDLEISLMRFEVDEVGRCFLLYPFHSRTQDGVYRVYSDITGDLPSVSLELVGGRNRTEDNHWNRKDSDRPLLAFDKRKLKMAGKAVKCDCH